MTAADVQFMERLATEVARAGRAHVRPKISSGVGGGHGSKTLAKNMEIRVGRLPKQANARIYIDHYWALYVHDGRPGFSAKNTEYLVWYHDRREDPRLTSTGGYPRRKRSVGKLNREEFKRDKALGKLVWVKSVGPMAASPFFDNEPPGGMAGFLDTKARPIILQRWRTHVLRRIKSIRDLKGTVVIKLG